MQPLKQIKGIFNSKIVPEGDGAQVIRIIGIKYSNKIYRNQRYPKPKSIFNVGLWIIQIACWIS